MLRDTFCSYCGTRYADTSSYPRTCAACGTQVWANPVPVAVVLLPVIDESRAGLLVVRRGIPPIGKLALVGGFVEVRETWQQCAAREVQEEAGISIDAATLEPLWYGSSSPVHDRVLLFSQAPALRAEDLPPFVPNTEATERGIIFGPGGPGGPGGAGDELAFPLHAEAARRFFSSVDVRGPLGFVPR